MYSCVFNFSMICRKVYLNYVNAFYFHLFCSSRKSQMKLWCWWIKNCVVMCGWLYIGYSGPCFLIIYYLVSRSMLSKQNSNTLEFSSEWMIQSTSSEPNSPQWPIEKNKKNPELPITYWLLNRTNWFPGIMVVIKKFCLNPDANFFVLCKYVGQDAKPNKVLNLNTSSKRQRI